MKLNKKGFTLIDVLAVLVILGILSAIAVPVISGIIENAETEVCVANSYELERMYHSHLDLEGIEHADGRFIQFMRRFSNDICPFGGEISYVDGKVQCRIHSSDADDNGVDEDDGSVPYL